MLRAVLRKVPANAVMTTNFQTLQPDKSLSQVLEYVYHGCQDDFPVMGDSGIQGILTRKDILTAIHEKGINIMISDVMDRDFFSIKPNESLDKD